MRTVRKPSLPALRFTRPLLGVWSVLSLTSLKSEDEVLSAVEDGRLLWAWNIASVESKKAMLRVLGQSVCEMIQGRQGIDTDFRPTVEKLIFPDQEDETISAGAIARAWNCSSSHVSHLCRSGELRIADCSPKRRPGSELIIDYASAANFLSRRRHF